MSLRRSAPSPDGLARLLAEAATHQPTYGPVGRTLGGSPAFGLQRKRWSTRLDGPDAFPRGRDALEAWAAHRGSGLLVAADGPLRAGTTVAMGAPLPLVWVEVTCRVVAVVDEADRFGFAYGTLPVHPECGEESFVVERRPDGAELVITADSRPAHVLARLAPPVAALLQSRATQRYLAAMRAATAAAT